MEIKDCEPGRRYRVFTTYNTGATTTFEGRIDDVMLLTSEHALIHWNKPRAVTVAAIDPRRSDNPKIEIHLLSDPLPTAPGTVMRHMADGDRRVEVVLVANQWFEVRSGDRVRLVDDPKFQVLYDPMVSIA